MRFSQSTLAGSLLASQTAYAAWKFNLPPGATPTSHDIYDLHMTIFWVCIGIGIIVFSIMFYAIIHHRKSKGVTPAQFHEHLWIELAWSFIPFVILILLAIPATRVLIHMRDTDAADITIKITGFQWKWQYDYLDQGIHFFSNMNTPFEQIHNKAPKTNDYLRTVDHPLVVPIHKKIRFLITANDVIHSWWVPELGIKQDAIPGFINEGWTRINRAGTYHGQCAELCGINHAYMPIVVVAMAQKDFAAWVAKQKSGGGEATTDINKVWALTELIQRGKNIYLGTCATCHKPDGSGMPPTFPNLKTSAVVNGPMDKHIHTVVFGVPGTAMQPFGKQFSPVDIAAVITYERNEISNRKGEIVQPSVIAAAEGIALPKQPLPATKPTAITPPATKATLKPSAAVTPPTPTAKVTLPALMQQGEKIFMSTCAVCHQASGLGIPPTFPALKSSKIATGPLPQHIDRVLYGKPGTAMQPFVDQLSDSDLAAVITYERNAWGNNTGTIVQPDDIKAARAKGRLN